jgi:predicted  nucleic acid-binding Zn-ribbon protein
MITQSINSKSKLADYKEYYKQAKAEIAELEAKLENKALNLSDYKRDYERRVGEHNKEVDFLIRDLTVLFTTAKRQVVQLFPVPVK